MLKGGIARGRTSFACAGLRPLSRRTSKSSRPDLLLRSLTEWILQLPDVTQASHSLGRVEFHVDGLEFVHFHGLSLLDIRLSEKDQERVLREGRAQHHRAVKHHREGWVSVRIGDEKDVDAVKELVQLAYSNARDSEGS